MKEAGERQTRTLARVPIPAARPTGTAIIVAGLLLLFIVCTGLTPWYWYRHAPAIQGFLCGVVICTGLMILYWRFSLGLLIVAVLLIGTCGTLGSLTGDLHSRTYRIYCNNTSRPGYAGDLNEDLLLLREGLIDTLKKENVIGDSPCPIEAEQGYAEINLGLRLHADPRLRGLEVAIQRFIAMKYGYPEDQVQGVKLYISDIASRFNTSTARMVAERSATLTIKPKLKAQFMIESRTLH